ncbi:MAG: hypothetical protein P8P49_02365 [Opitutales bacterium]|nr:hypothetical protein [Opitutales bacterium]
MVNTGLENQEVMKRFFSGEMSEEERLAILDENGSADVVKKYWESSNFFTVDKDLPKNVERTDAEKIEDLIKQGEVNFAIDLIKGLGENISDYDKFIKGGRIDPKGRPWPSTFCTSIKEASSWDWGERDVKLYEMFGKLVENCPQNVSRDLSLIGSPSTLNLSENGAEGYYSAISSFPLLRELTIKESLENLSSKCPNLRYIDFRRFSGSIDLSMLSGCEKLSEINFMHTSLKNLSGFPNLQSLKRINLRRCWYLEELESMPDSSSLEVLELHDCRELKTLGDMSRFPSLSRLNLLGCQNLELPENIEDLNISDLILPSDTEEK